MADTKQILHHIAELYAKPRKEQTLEDAVFEMEEKMLARYGEYNKAFEGKLTTDIIKAVDDYWRFKSDKTRPTLALILAMENSDVTKKERKETDPESAEGMKRRYIKCMRELYDKYGLSGAQCYHRALLNTYDIPYPATEEIWEQI